jgi:1,4-alpha-glucan branching enzyme
MWDMTNSWVRPISRHVANGDTSEAVFRSQPAPPTVPRHGDPTIKKIIDDVRQLQVIFFNAACGLRAVNFASREIKGWRSFNWGGYIDVAAKLGDMFLPEIVQFSFRPGPAAIRFENVRLCGSWNADGRSASEWTAVPMWPSSDADGATVFRTQVSFDSGEIGKTFRWGIFVDGPAGMNRWAIAAEIDDENSTRRERSFVLQQGLTEQSYFLTWWRRLGAYRVAGPDGRDGICFSVWAPNARAAALVLADPAIGYVADDGTGAVKTVAMTRGDGGIWSAGPADAPALADFAAMVGTPYMFGITKDDGSVAYRTDLWSLMQIGAGDFDPHGAAYAGPPGALDGPQSCSVVCDPTKVVLGPGQEVTAEGFWADEFVADRPLPARIEDIVIYELHVGALGFGKQDPGTLQDAIAFVDHLERLGVNAVELLPIAEFEARANWGYGTSHFFATDQAAGGTDRLKMFVKACHRRGIAVILDVCYNHFDPDGERAEWAYDSNDPARNIYYWYEGKPSDYSDPTGGYIDNLSTGWRRGSMKRRCVSFLSPARPFWLMFAMLTVSGSIRPARSINIRNCTRTGSMPGGQPPSA